MITPKTDATDGAAIRRLLGESTDENTLKTPENTGETVTEPLAIHAENTGTFRPLLTENTHLEALARQIVQLQAEGANKGDIMRQVWNVNPGATQEYREAVVEYQQCMRLIASRIGA